MSTKTYLLYCNFCGFKKITDGTKEKDMIEIKVSPLFLSPPTLDPITNKTIEAKFKKRPKRFKCPNCGRVIFPKKLKDNEKQVGYQPDDQLPIQQE